MDFMNGGTILTCQLDDYHTTREKLVKINQPMRVHSFPYFTSVD